MNRRLPVSQFIKSYGVLLVTIALVIVTVVISIGFRTPDNAYWPLIGLLKFLSTISLVIISLVYVLKAGNGNRAAYLLISALIFESFCDFFIEFSFPLGGILSLIGMCLYSLSFIVGNKKKRLNIKIIPVTIGLLLLFFIIQLGILQIVQKAYDVKTDGVFLVYMFILSLTTAIALTTDISRGLKAGMLIFYVSDYIVYLQVLIGLTPCLRIMNAILYYSAQIAFVCSIIQSADGKKDLAGQCR